MELAKLPIRFPKTGISHIRHYTPHKLPFVSCQVHCVIIYCVEWLHAMFWMEQQQKKACPSRIDPPKFHLVSQNQRVQLNRIGPFLVDISSQPYAPAQQKLMDLPKNGQTLQSRGVWTHKQWEREESTNKGSVKKEAQWTTLPLQTIRILHHRLHLLHAHQPGNS